MPGTITSAAIYGIDARPVTVEVDVHGGLPKVTVVGLPDTAVQEARERIRSAIKNSGGQFPTTHVTISLSPAEWRKEGAGFDVPVAVALLVATKQLPNIFGDALLIGELNLAGEVKPTNGVLAIAELARSLGKRLIVPAANAAEAALIQDVNVVPLHSLEELMQLAYATTPWPRQKQTVNVHKQVSPLQVWSSIRGQQSAKRAMLIAAAGGHNVLMVGSPGSGKTLLARGMRELLPPMSEAEALTVIKIHSIGGQLNSDLGLTLDRPFRQPHHTASVAALVGGGRSPKPGELSLAHHGVLFLDEFAEFSREHIEALRQPLEDGIVTVSRVAGTAQFPAAGMLIAAMNPCPCGFLYDREKTCRCSPSHIRRYQQRISGPILDRFDLFIQVPRVTVREIRDTQKDVDDPRARVTQARKQQYSRTKEWRLTNSQLRGQALFDVCELTEDSQKILFQAMERWRFSMRAYHRILRVSRTIADLANSATIATEHVAEALQYRPPTNLAEREV